MTDKERQEDEKLKKCLQTAYGATDEQLLKELEEAEASLDASEFPGAEERMFRRFMEMEREEREKENLSEDAVQDNMAVPGMDTAGGGMGADGTDKNKKKIRKFGKKKVFLVAALVAVFVGALGVTAVGEKNYFFRGYDLILDNDNNKMDMSELERAYKKIEEESDVKLLKLGYIPSDLLLENLVISQDRVILQFSYRGNKVYFVQGCSINTTSLTAKSDRMFRTEIVKNEWMNQDVEIRENQLENGDIEYEAQFYYENAYYMLSGKMDKEDFISIIKNVNYF
ncbi:DUF4367 domain-containing protein [Alitiscatomonas aceti]|uniref:DUF4367 domain-containing protein n=1 Tax=Alitiscatomonas aceti TaxID=2981724 RepID=A0ABT2UZK9_9FIRM|nr:DUF4367 domain-containing protein [Alitiscatomonas aceti]MCU6800080.1 DUF4367 domain-containing protein [Alitiscatomonas aceti]